LSRLHELSVHLVAQQDMEGLLSEFVGAAVELMHTDMGNMQILEGDGNLRIVAHRGFELPFLDFFRIVKNEVGASCGAAKEAGKRVIVQDITTSPIFVGTPSLKVMLHAGVRACQSTPLISRSGELIGVISTHFREPHVPSESDLRLLDLLARQAADLIERMRDKQELDSYSKNLEALVRERTSELEMILEMERQSRREAILLQDILTHDIRNYCQVIRLCAEMLVEKAEGSEVSKKMLMTQISSLDAMNDLVEKAKKLARVVSEGKPSLHSVDLLSIIDSAINLVGKSDGSFANKRVNHRLIVLPSSTVQDRRMEGPPAGQESQRFFAIADELLRDVFLNLYSNSVRHCDGTEVMIETTICEENGDTSSPREEGSRWEDTSSAWVKVSISDNARGISDELKQRLFTRFLNGAKGTGLGMSIVHALVVERYRGRLRVKDRVDGDYTKGTLIEVLLPKSPLKEIQAE